MSNTPEQPDQVSHLRVGREGEAVQNPQSSRRIRLSDTKRTILEGVFAENLQAAGAKAIGCDIVDFPPEAGSEAKGLFELVDRVIRASGEVYSGTTVGYTELGVGDDTSTYRPTIYFPTVRSSEHAAIQAAGAMQEVNTILEATLSPLRFPA